MSSKELGGQQFPAVEALNAQLSAAGLRLLDSTAIAKFGAYLGLILRWNARTNLTSVRNPEGIVARHFVESIASAQFLPAGITTLLDFGSGAGFPGLPIAICRPEIAITLAESQNKKAAFLQEAVRALSLENVQVFSDRAETINQQFDCVTMRAVDSMGAAVSMAAQLLTDDGVMALFTTTLEFPDLERRIVGIEWRSPILLPGSDQRVLRLGLKRSGFERNVPRGTSG